MMKRNKCFMGLSDYGPPGKYPRDKHNKNMAKHAIKSAVKNTTMDIIFIYDGVDEKFVEQIEKQKVKVVMKSSRFNKHWKNKPKQWRYVARGAYLRMEIPDICHDLILDEEHVLYSDCDVIFLKNPELENHAPEIFSASTETKKDWPFEEKYEDMNSGIMWMNINGMKKTFNSFVQTALEKNFNTVTFDQEILKRAYWRLWDYLPEKLNWKPYWGLPSKDTEIIHYHGPKAYQMKKYLEDGVIEDPLKTHIEIEEKLGVLEYYIDLFEKYDD